jgi:hypothetical protein
MTRLARRRRALQHTDVRTTAALRCPAGVELIFLTGRTRGGAR